MTTSTVAFALLAIDHAGLALGDDEPSIEFSVAINGAPSTFTVIRLGADPYHLCNDGDPDHPLGTADTIIALQRAEREIANRCR